jgi:hypothetical protein
VLARRAAVTLVTTLAVAGSTAGCHVERPSTGPTAVVDESPARPPDPLADLDAVLDSVEQDLDAASADR